MHEPFLHTFRTSETQEILQGQANEKCSEFQKGAYRKRDKPDAMHELADCEITLMT